MFLFIILKLLAPKSSFIMGVLKSSKSKKEEVKFNSSQK